MKNIFVKGKNMDVKEKAKARIEELKTMRQKVVDEANHQIASINTSMIELANLADAPELLPDELRQKAAPGPTAQGETLPDPPQPEIVEGKSV
jgi:hypothetical protein